MHDRLWLGVSIDSVSLLGLASLFSAAIKLLIFYFSRSHMIKLAMNVIPMSRGNWESSDLKMVLYIAKSWKTQIHSYDRLFAHKVDWKIPLGRQLFSSKFPKNWIQDNSSRISAFNLNSVGESNSFEFKTGILVLMKERFFGK